MCPTSTRRSTPRGRSASSGAPSARSGTGTRICLHTSACLRRWLWSARSKRGAPMGKYLIKASYTLDGVKGVVSGGGSARRQAVEQTLSSVGESVEAFYFGFGDTDA